MLIDLSKACDCIPHNLLIEALLYVYSYLTNRKHCVRISNTYYSQLKTAISGLPQGSILGMILLSQSINDLFLFVATTVSRLIKVLESESEVVIDWFKKNKMVVNLDKF